MVREVVKGISTYLVWLKKGREKSFLFFFFSTSPTATSPSCLPKAVYFQRYCLGFFLAWNQFHGKSWYTPETGEM